MIECTVMGAYGTLTLDIKPQSLLGAQTAIAHSVNMIVSGHHDG